MTPGTTLGTTLGKRITGCWIHRDSENNPYLTIPLLHTKAGTERRFRIYLHEHAQGVDAPNASLWIKRTVQGGTRELTTYVRLTGLWLRTTRKGARYFFLQLQEGNFRLYLNSRRPSLVGEGVSEESTNQPDYTLYQYTDAAGLPLTEEPAPY